MTERDFKKLKEYYVEKTNPKPKPEPLMCEPGDVIVSGGAYNNKYYYYVLSGYGTEIRVASDDRDIIYITNISTLRNKYTKSTKAPKILVDFINDKPSEIFKEGMIVRARKGYKFQIYNKRNDEELLEASNIGVVVKISDPMITIGASLKLTGKVYTEITVNKDLLVEYTEEDARLDEIKRQQEIKMKECCLIL